MTASASTGRGSVAPVGEVVGVRGVGAGISGAVTVPGSLAAVTVHVTGGTLGRYTNFVTISGARSVGRTKGKDVRTHTTP